MPCDAGEQPVAIEAQAGPVKNGTALSSTPDDPRSRNAARFGRRPVSSSGSSTFHEQPSSPTAIVRLPTTLTPCSPLHRYPRIAEYSRSAGPQPLISEARAATVDGLGVSPQNAEAHGDSLRHGTTDRAPPRVLDGG